MVCKEMFGDAMVVSALFNKAPMFPKPCSECPYGPTNIKQPTGTGKAVYDKVRRAIVKFFEGVTFSFYVEGFLAMVYELAGEAEGFFTLIHPSEGYKDRLWRDGLEGLDFTRGNFAFDVL